MRLIDADLLKQNCKCTGKFEDNFIGVDLITLANVIDNQPTAYDVEAKVAELENAMKTALDEVKLPIPIFVSKRSLQEFVDICFGEAISIVRGKE